MTRLAAAAAGATLLLAAAGCARPPAPATPPAPVYEWRLPPGFPRPPVPADNPMSAAKVELGRHLFADSRLSGTGTASCATCHRPELAFTDGLPRAVGATGELHPRSAMSLANVAYNRSFNWADPSLRSLEEQMLVPLFNQRPVELGASGRVEEILSRLADTPDYPALFARAFPGQEQPITLDNVIRAIASYERTLISGDSPYDRLVYWDERAALSPAARRGMALFFSPRLRCSECHAGFNLSGPVTWEGAQPGEQEFHNTGLYNLDGKGAYPDGNRGLFEITGKPGEMGRFRAPTLRNIALTAPYMHDGSIATLAEVVEFYAAGGRAEPGEGEAAAGRENPFKSELLSGFEIGEEEKVDLVAFLESLTDRAFLAASPVSEF